MGLVTGPCRLLPSGLSATGFGFAAAIKTFGAVPNACVILTFQRLDLIIDRPERFTLFCDDLSFEASESSYKVLQKSPRNTCCGGFVQSAGQIPAAGSGGCLGEGLPWVTPGPPPAFGFEPPASSSGSRIGRPCMMSSI